MVIGAASAIVVPQVYNRGKLQVNFFSVGQGDSALIRLPTGEDILIDGGPNNDVLEKLGTRLPFFDRKIELVVLTHPHMDHVFGLIEVLKRYEVDKILTTNAENPAEFFKEWKKVLEDKHIPIEIADRGDKFRLGDVEFEVLWPIDGSIVVKDDKKFNGNSVVFNLKYGEHEILFTGDITCDAEEDMLKLGKIWKTDEKGFEILKVPHHGSKTSSCNNFLKALNPDEAIVSVGQNNRYNLPSPYAIERLQNFTKKLWRTDEEGDAGFVCDEIECEIKVD